MYRTCPIAFSLLALAAFIPGMGVAEDIEFVISSNSLQELAYGDHVVPAMAIHLASELLARELVDATLEARFEAGRESDDEFAEFQIALLQDGQLVIPPGKNRYISAVSMSREPATVDIDIRRILGPLFEAGQGGEIRIALGCISEDCMGNAMLLPLEEAEDVWCRLLLVVE
jgi:hypothetical protein